MRRALLFACLLLTGALVGCAGPNQNFSCAPSESWQHAGDTDIFIRPPTRNAAGYLQC